MTEQTLIPFTLPNAPRFRAQIRPSSLDKLRKFFSKTPKQQIRAQMSALRPGPDDVGAAIREGIKHARVGTRRIPSGRYGTLEARGLTRAELVRKVATCGAENLPFWAYHWAYQSTLDGLHVWPECEAECAPELECAA